MADENQAAGGSANVDRTNSNALQESQKMEKFREEKDEIQAYLDNMRGWLVTVSTLFVAMAFQAAMQPPAWMPKPEDWARAILAKSAHEQRTLAFRTAVYQSLNTMTFSSALTIVVLLLVIDRSKFISPARMLRFITTMVAFLSIFVAVNFVVGITNIGRVTVYLGCLVVLCAMEVTVLCAVQFIRRG